MRKADAGLECPTAVVFTVTYAGQPVDLDDAECLAPGDYTITVVSPTGSGVVYSWKYKSGDDPYLPFGDGSASVVYAMAPSAPETVIKVEIAITDCAELEDSVTLPPASQRATCPDTAVVNVSGPSGPLTAPYEDLPAGDYRAEVVDPVGPDVSYTFTLTPAYTTSQSGPDARYDFELPAGALETTLAVIVDTACCDPLNPVVVLHPHPVGGQAERPTETPAAQTSRACAAMRLTAAIALATALIAFAVALCVPPTVSVLMPVALAAAAVFAVALLLLLLLCGLDWCGFARIVCWALKWASVVLALVFVVLAFTGRGGCVAIFGLLYAIFCGLLIARMRQTGCAEPAALGAP